MRERNPDLPLLDELGNEFEAMVEAAWAAEAPTAARPTPDPAGADRHTARRRAPAPPSRQARERGAQVRRVGRRATILLVLVCLIGGVAFAALRGGGSNGPAHTAPTPLGRAGDGAWSFSAYRDGGRLCTVFVPRGGELSGSCGAAPGPGQLRAGSAIAGGRRYIFGITGAGVARATASLAEGAGTPNGIRRKAAGLARAPIDRSAAADAGFPAGDGWFVFDLGPVGSTGRAGAPAVVTPFDRRGRRAGPAYVDCSLGIIGPACKRRIEAAAAAGD